MQQPKQQIGLLTAVAIVIANMIGTGVFTSVGYQLASVQNTFSILLLWIFGGIMALFGAFAYAELGTRFSQSGGDYIYLSRIFYPVLGYLSAWAGLTVGFSAPVALAAMAFIQYLAPFGLAGSYWVSIALIVVISTVHSFTISHSSRFQNASTIVKTVFVIVLIGIALLLPAAAGNALVFSGSWRAEVFTPGFAVSMVYVSFAYTGWNAAAYIAGEINKPLRNIPRALIASTLFVAVVYVLFQYGLLKHAAAVQLVNKEEATYIAFTNLLGTTGGKWVSFFIAIQLIATISSYLWVGPRVTQAMAAEHRLWKPLSTTNKHGIPVAATWLHAGISIALVLSGSFETVLLYAGFVLQLMSSLTVAASLFISHKTPGGFRSPLKPWLQVIFLLFSVWVLVFTFWQRPLESLMGLGILLAGWIIYLFDRPLHPQQNLVAEISEHV